MSTSSNSSSSGEKIEIRKHKESFLFSKIKSAQEAPVSSSAVLILIPKMKHLSGQKRLSYRAQVLLSHA